MIDILPTDSYWRIITPLRLTNTPVFLVDRTMRHNMHLFANVYTYPQKPSIWKSSYLFLAVGDDIDLNNES